MHFYRSKSTLDSLKSVFKVLKGTLSLGAPGCTGIAEVNGSNPVQAWIFFRLSFRNFISCVYNCDDLSSNKRVDSHYKLQKKTDNRLHLWINGRPPITRTFKAKRVRVIGSTKQITRSKEMGWAGEEYKYHALPTSRAAKDIDILDKILYNKAGLISASAKHCIWTGLTKK